MKTHEQIKTLIKELQNEADIDSSKADHHTIAIEVLELATTCLTKPTLLTEAILESECKIRREALQWVLSDI